MTESERNLGHQWFDEVWNKGRRDAIGELLAPDVAVHDGNVNSSGPAAFYSFFDRMNDAFTEIHVDVDDSFAAGETLCIRWTCTAKHTGAGLGFPATQKKMRVTGISVVRVANGQFAEVWQNWDMMGMMEQLRNSAQSPTYIADSQPAVTV